MTTTHSSPRAPTTAGAGQRPPDDPRRTLSLERRLPLLMTAVLAVVLATSLALTYRTLANTARTTARGRLTQVARIIATTALPNTRTRLLAIELAARDSAVHRALRAARDTMHAASRIDVAAASRLLQTLQLPADSNLPTTLWTADGRRVATVGDQPTLVEQPELATRPPPVVAQRTGDSAYYSALSVSDGHVYYHIVAPVEESGERLGYVVELRRVGSNRRLPDLVRDVTGQEVALYSHQPGSAFWASLATGHPSPPATRVSEGFSERPSTGLQLTNDMPLPGTPWILTLEEPVRSVLRAPREAVFTLAWVALLLTIVGAAASWAVSRRITRPLVLLTAAAEAVARGDYASRVHDGGGDEVGRLARSFNAMAAEVDGAQQALARQFADERAVADELAATNQRLQEAVREVEESRDAAEYANRAKSDFLAVMSHELRTPLNAIGGYTDLMQLGIYGPITAQQENALDRIMRSQQHLLGLINDVLNFAKLSAAKAEFDVRDMSIREAISTVETMIAPQLDAKGLRYSTLLGDDPLIARADREKVQQVLLNLLSNAVKFTPTDGSITVTAIEADDALFVSVHDTGIGIPTDRLSHIFEPFVQVDRALNRPHDGVGLGLAISHDLALGMGGVLRAESTLGAGSTFTLQLPRA